MKHHLLILEDKESDQISGWPSRGGALVQLTYWVSLGLLSSTRRYTHSPSKRFRNLTKVYSSKDSLSQHTKESMSNLHERVVNRRAGVIRDFLVQGANDHYREWHSPTLKKANSCKALNSAWHTLSVPEMPASTSLPPPRNAAATDAEAVICYWVIPQPLQPIFNAKCLKLKCLSNAIILYFFYFPYQ